MTLISVNNFFNNVCIKLCICIIIICVIINLCIKNNTITTFTILHINMNLHILYMNFYIFIMHSIVFT